MSAHPMQPIELDAQGVIRFKRNAIVRFLLDWATERGMSLNELAVMNFSDEDRTQFAQLIGYSVSGFGELSYADPQTVQQADANAAQIVERSAAEGDDEGDE